MKNQKKKRMLMSLAFLTAGISACLCACGGFGAKNGNGVVSGGAVSGNAVSGQAVSEEAVKAKEVKNSHIYANDTNFYIGAWAEVFDYIEESGVVLVSYQKNDLTKRETFQIDDFKGLLCVSEEGVYYCKKNSFDTEAYDVWRIPIQKNEDGTDHLQKESEEKILTEKGGIIVDNRGYVNDRYIVYFTYDDYVVKYDLRTGEEQRHLLVGNISELEPIDENNLIIASEYGGIYCWNLDSDKWEKVSGIDSCDEPAATNGVSYFYTDESTVRRYDIKTGEDREFLSGDRLHKACEKVVKDQGGSLDSAYMYKIFCQEDKLYLEFQIDWKKEKAYRMNYVIFSVDLRKGNKISLEEGMMDCIKKNSHEDTLHTKKMKGCNKVVWDAGCCEYMVEGKAIFIFDKEDQVGCYDMADGTFRHVSYEDEEYYLPYYDYNSSEAYPEWLMEDVTMNFVPMELDGYFWC